MPHSTSAIIAARRIAARAPAHEIPSPRNLGVTFALIMTLSAGCQLEVGGINAQATGPGAGGASTSTSSRTTGVSTGGGESMSGGGTGGGGTGGGGMSGGSMSGGGNPSSSASGTCMGTAEVCNDGKDNNCDGMVDCADPACKSMGFACVPTIPNGWNSVAFSLSSRPSCPSGYTSFDIVSASAAAYTCTCNCTQNSQPSCTQGTIDVASNGAAPCPPNTSFSLSANNGMCNGVTLTTFKDGLVNISAPQATQGSCSANVSSTPQPPMQTQGRVCLAPSSVGIGCADGGACVTSPQAPLSSCIVHSGAQQCPPGGYSKRFSVGSSVQDTRMCSPCVCGTMSTCTSPKLTFFADGMCMGGGHDLPVTGKCDSVNDGNGHVYKSYHYSATVTNPDCQQTQASEPIGSLSLMGEGTVCCP